jgi:hypothetical protein
MPRTPASSAATSESHTNPPAPPLRLKLVRRGQRVRSAVAMPPRRSARVVAAAQHAAPALAPLPHALVLHILSLLPVDCRLLCAGVCRS